MASLCTGCKAWVEKSAVRHVQSASETIEVCEPFLEREGVADLGAMKPFSTGPLFAAELGIVLGDLDALELDISKGLSTTIGGMLRRNELAIECRAHTESDDTVKLSDSDLPVALALLRAQDTACTVASPTSLDRARLDWLRAAAAVTDDLNAAATAAREVARALAAFEPATVDGFTGSAFDLSPRQAAREFERIDKLVHSVRHTTMHDLERVLDACDTNCRDAILTLVEVTTRAPGHLADLESAATKVRNELERRRRQGREIDHEFEAAFGEATGRLRQHVAWIGRAASIVDGLANARAFARAFAKRHLVLLDWDPAV